MGVIILLVAGVGLAILGVAATYENGFPSGAFNLILGLALILGAVREAGWLGRDRRSDTSEPQAEADAIERKNAIRWGALSILLGAVVLVDAVVYAADDRAWGIFGIVAASLLILAGIIWVAKSAFLRR